MTNSPKRHHIIPKFYLKGFSENGQIEIYSLNGAKPYRSSITRAFAENNFYRSASESADDPLQFESYLARKEQDASTSLRRLRNDKTIGLTEKESISEFLLIQWTRGRDFRMSSEAFLNLAMRDMARESSKTDVRIFHELLFSTFTTDDEWEGLWDRYLSDEGPGISNPIDRNLEMVQRLSTVALQSLLLIRKWVVIDFGEPALISCDRPVITVPLVRGQNFVTGPGLAKCDQIVFPLSRDKALILENLSGSDNDFDMGKIAESVHWTPGDTDHAAEINRLVALNAQERVFGHPSETETLRQACESSHNIEQWTTGSDWSDATKRISELKDTVVDLFKEMTREELQQAIEKMNQKNLQHKLQM